MIKLITLLIFISSNALSQDCIEQLSALFNYREYLALKIDGGFTSPEDNHQLQAVNYQIAIKRGSYSNYRYCSLEAIYPRRIRDLNSVRNAFKIGKDVPANKFASVHQGILRTFNKIQATVQDLTNISGVDVSSLISLMRDPIDIWDEMANCHGQDLEQVREAYRRGRDFCPGNRSKNRELENRLKLFHTNLVNFLSTTQNIQEVNQVLKDELFICEDNVNCLQNNKERYFSIRELFHPLLGQALLGVISQNGIFKNVNDSNAVVSNRFTRRSILTNASEMIAYFGPNNCYALALWPAAARPMLQSTIVSELQQPARIFSENCGHLGSYHNIYRNYDGLWGTSISNRSAQRQFVTKTRDIFEQY